MVDRSSCAQYVAALALLVLGASSAAAQASIEVVASSRRDGISVMNRRQQIGLAEDGTIAFGASTPAGFDRLMVAGPGSAAVDLGINARNGGDVAINDDSIVFMYSRQVLGLRRNPASTATNVLQDCLDPATPCGPGDVHLSMASDGYFGMTSWDSSGGFYKGRVRNGSLSLAELTPVPVFSGFITAFGIDVRRGGPMLIQGDHSAPNAEVFGAFLSTPFRNGWAIINTVVSTRPRGGNEMPVAAAFADLTPIALMPAQTDGLGTTLAGPALVRGASQPYGTWQVMGTPVLPLQSVAGGSMDANDLGLAAVVATLPNGWAGLFTFQALVAGAQPVPLISLNSATLRRRCGDFATSMHVLGTNNAGQMAVLARVVDGNGVVDNQVWRVTPTPTLPTTTSYCWTPRVFIGWP
jgi:hypothetical protein